MRYLEKKLHAADPSAPLGTSNNPSHVIFTLANAITVLRIVLTIVFFVLFCLGLNRVICLILYAIAASTDFLDGFIARKTHTVSWFGKLLDPIVDRILIFAGVLGLFVAGELPFWILCFLFLRDCILALGMLLMRHIHHRPIDVLFIGKLTTALLMFGFTWMLIGWPIISGCNLFSVSFLPGFNGVSVCPGIFFVYAGVICSAITFFLYLFEGILAIKETSVK